jgi:hypothetical protein
MIRLLAPSRSPFIAVKIEIAIIAVPVKAVNRKPRCEAPRIDRKSCSNAL